MAINPRILAGTSKISNPDGTLTVEYRMFLIQLFKVIPGQVAGWSPPTGTGSRATINADFTTVVSNPPTQAQVTAIRDQLIAVQKALAQLITDSTTSGVLAP